MQTRGYAPFSNNLSPPVTLKMGSRSPKSNQHFSQSQWYICVSLAKIYPFNKEKSVQTRGYARFSNNLSPHVALKMGSRSPKSNQQFSPSQWYIHVSLAKICPFNKERVQTSGYADVDRIRTKNNISLRMVGGHKNLLAKQSCCIQTKKYRLYSKMTRSDCL